MKKILLLSAAAFLLTGIACKKEKNAEPESPTPETPVNTDNYSSIDAFYLQNGVKTETFSFNAGTGGSYTSAKGTTVIIPANVFSPSSAQIKIEFKDIYKKSDMLLSRMPTNTYDRKPLKSAGEFFIRALNNDVPVSITNTVVGISILQPFKEPADKAMLPFNAFQGADSTQNFSWVPSVNDNVAVTASNYVYSFYQFQNPTGGSWCNSDNSSFFSSYTQTKLTIHPNQNLQNTNVYLIFKSVNSVIHVFQSANNDFVYNYAPVGLQCTMVTVGVKDGKLQASFTPVTIGTNQTVNFSPTEFTSEVFKTTLNALN